MTDDARVRHGGLLAAGYVVAALLVVIPLVETIIYALPFTPSAVRWRYGLVGYIGQGITLPALGVFLAVVLAAELGHRRLLRTLSVFCWATALVLAGSGLLFLFDLLQIRGEVALAMRQNYDAASVKALAGLGLTCVLGVWLGIAAWRGSRREEPAGASRRAGVVVRPPAGAEFSDA